jgi:DNA-directed RNA polymerase specialized sigma24 family protein
VGDSDVFQSAVSRFLWGLRLGKFDVSNPQELLGLLRRIAERRVYRAARFWGAQCRDVKRTGDVADVSDTALIAADPTPSKAVLEQELIAETLSRLPEDARKLVQWRQEGLGWAQIAERLGGTATAESARKQYERALAKVAAELGIEDDS